MSDDKKIKDIYMCKNIVIDGELYPLQKWYNQLIEKKISEIEVTDVLRMIRQNEFINIAILKAIDYLKENPFIGDMYDGELLEKLCSVDLKYLKNYIKEIKIILSNAIKKNDRYIWLNEDERIGFEKLIKEFRDKIERFEDNSYDL